VRRSGKPVRITGQLIDASTGADLWADRFDGALEDIFDLQDQLTTSVVGAVTPKLEQAEIERAKYKSTDNLDAYDYFLRGRESSRKWTREGNIEALRLLRRAMQLDPDFAAAYAMAAVCYVNLKVNGWTADREHDSAETARLCRRAVELGRDDATALCYAGFSLAYVVGDLDGGAAFVDRATALNPNFSMAWYFSGWLHVWLGQQDVAIAHLARAMRLSPVDPTLGLMQTAIAFSHYLDGRYDEASSWAEKAVRDAPNFFATTAIAAASNALAGRIGKAQDAMARLRQLAPDRRISNLRDQFPARRPEDLARLEEGLRRAGLPE